MAEHTNRADTLDIDLRTDGIGDWPDPQPRRPGVLRAVLSVLAMTVFCVLAVVFTVTWALITLVVTLVRGRRTPRSPRRTAQPSPLRVH